MNRDTSTKHKSFIARLQLSDPDNAQFMSRGDLAATRKAIMGYKLKDELSYFNRKSLKKRNKNPQK